MKNIEIKKSMEMNYETGKEVPTLWLSFSCKDGSGSMINLNNLGHKDAIMGHIILKAIKEYFEDSHE